jgi:hypothetical protein
MGTVAECENFQGRKRAAGNLKKSEEKDEEMQHQ